MQRYRVHLERVLSETVALEAPSAGAAVAEVFGTAHNGYSPLEWYPVAVERAWSQEDNSSLWLPVPKTEWTVR